MYVVGSNMTLIVSGMVMISFHPHFLLKLQLELYPLLAEAIRLSYIHFFSPFIYTFYIVCSFILNLIRHLDDPKCITLAFRLKMTMPGTLVIPYFSYIYINSKLNLLLFHF